ncbi:MAG: sigma-54-dependent Fis family transcriptional regulator [Hahellaceae bacterium]|nr:sigma-54-dependent Fis family transcriptional regulator [Hahellaceae bacterium]MCP5170041.1 sigma-54-dependent Fis family transcriptional regulator [Hahellaceae bacterium]
MSIKNALIVDDEPDIRELIEITLMRMGIDTRAAENITKAQQLLKEQPFSLCLTDMHLPDGSGIDLVAHIQKNYPQMPVAVITAYGSMETAIQSLKAGAFDFVSKPVDLARLRELVNTALRLVPESDAVVDQSSSENLLLGKSESMEQLRKQIRKLARSQAPVYISGESGSGKERVANMIHLLGPRKDKPFVPVNCGAIPGELMESEFFGHKKGSFSGAIENKEGLFQAADGGTLFLDEVADLPLAMQVKLLRAIQEKAIRPVGEQKERTVDVRILSATHKNLASLVEDGSFRQDLYYRINVIELQVPPLRARNNDVALLANHILQQIAAECEIDGARISPAAMAKLENYAFPGNVRELENIIERAFTLCENDTIEVQDLQLRQDALSTSEPHVVQSHHSSSDDSERPFAPAIPRDQQTSLEDYLESIERKSIEQALEACRWNKTAAAKKLGISFRALRYRLKKLGME